MVDCFLCYIQPDLSEVRLAEVKKNKKNTGHTAVFIKAVYQMIDKRAITPVKCHIT